MSGKMISVAAMLAAAFEKQEAEAEFRDLWDKLDKNGDGKVTGKEWGSKVYAEQELMSKYFGGSSLKEIGEGFNRIDSNGDDNLTWDEFVSEIKSYSAAQKMSAAMGTQEGKEDFKKLWETLDKNGDGKVSGKEWGSQVYAQQDIMKKYFGGQDLASIGKGFRRINADGDEFLTWEEFTGGATNWIAS